MKEQYTVYASTTTKQKAKKQIEQELEDLYYLIYDSLKKSEDSDFTEDNIQIDQSFEKLYELLSNIAYDNIIHEKPEA